MIKVTFIVACHFGALFLSGCESDSINNVNDHSESDQYDILEVNQIWQGSVPVAFDNIGYRCGEGEIYILIPYAISLNNPLQLELYGCWQGSRLITCVIGNYEGATVVTNNRERVVLSLRKSPYEFQDCQANEPQFRKVDTLVINGAWPSGELEILVRNTDSELSGYVAVE